MESMQEDFREIVLDTETTGLSPENGHRITEIGCVELINKVPTENYFHIYVNPDRDLPNEVFEITGISEDFLKQQPLFEEVAESFLDFIGDAPLVIHNAKFDMAFLNFELSQLGIPPLPFQRAIDTLLMARKMFPGQPANLDALSKRFNIHIAREKHGALLDAQILTEVYIELCGGRQRSLRLKEPDKSTQKSDKQAVQFPYRKFPPSNEELAQFNENLTKIHDPLWNEEDFL